MTVFRIISIIISVVFIVLAVFNANGLLNETLQKVTNVFGITTAMLNVISVVGWWAADKENQYNKTQLSWVSRRRLLH